MTKWTIQRRPAVLAAGALGSLALALSANGTLSAFTAQITNSTNTAATGSLTMKETLLDASGNPTSTVCNSTDGGSVSTNSATCASINKYGGTATPLTPGGAANTTKIQIQNTGNVPANAFTLTPGTCGQTGISPSGTATNVCSKINVVITSGPTTIYSGTAAGLTAGIDLKAKLGGSPIAAGAVVPFTITVSLDSTADNTYSGFQVGQPLAWSFTS